MQEKERDEFVFKKEEESKKSNFDKKQRVSG